MCFRDVLTLHVLENAQRRALFGKLLGIVPLHDMIPETALVKAMWAAAFAKDRDGIRNIMLERTALEFST